MSNTLLRNARIVDPAHPGGRRVDILVEGERIAAVAAAGSIDAARGANVDASAFAVIPGLVNAHTHAHGVLLRSTSDRWTLEHLISAAPWTGGGRSPGHHALAAKLGAAEMIAKGCTAAFDMFGEYPQPTIAGMHEVAGGYAEAGLRAVVAPMMADRSFYTLMPEMRAALSPELVQHIDGIRYAPFETSVAVCRELAQSWPFPRDQVKLGLGPTIPLHCSDGFIEACARLAREFELPVQMHVAESRLQAVIGRERYGMTLAAHIEKLGLLAPGFCAAHGVWLEPEDHARFAKVGASIAHNPGSNMRLGSGIGAMRAWLDAGINVGIGTDGVICSDNLNMFESMRLAAYVSRVRGQVDQPTAHERWIGAGEAMRAATEGGAKLVGLAGKIGRIEAGYLADLVLLDLRATHYLPLNELLPQIVYAEDGTAVDSVMIGGKWVYRERRHLTVDLARLAREAENAVESIRTKVAPLRARSDAIEPFVTKFADGIRARFCAAGCAHSTALVGAA